jgi:hypothetical protein
MQENKEANIHEHKTGIQGNLPISDEQEKLNQFFKGFINSE